MQRYLFLNLAYLNLATPGTHEQKAKPNLVIQFTSGKLSIPTYISGRVQSF